MNKGMPNHNTGEIGEVDKAWRIQTAAAAPGLPFGYFEAFFTQHEDALLLLDRSQQTALYNRQFAQWQGWTIRNRPLASPTQTSTPPNMRRELPPTSSR